MKGVGNSYDYFMEGRRWFFGAFFVFIVLYLVDTFLKGMEWGTRLIVPIQVTLMLLACVAGSISEKRVVQLGVAVMMLALGLFYMFSGLGVLG